MAFAGADFVCFMFSQPAGSVCVNFLVFRNRCYPFCFFFFLTFREEVRAIVGLMCYFVRFSLFPLRMRSEHSSPPVHERPVLRA